MDHHGKVAKDGINGIWSAHCTCDQVWDAHDQQNAFKAIFLHVRVRRAMGKIGMGFRADIQ